MSKIISEGDLVYLKSDRSLVLTVGDISYDFATYYWITDGSVCSMEIPLDALQLK